jgi:hypothetical protein
MTMHWIIYPEHQGTITYEEVDYVPSPKSSRLQADEIEGRNWTQAIGILESMYEEVKPIKRGKRIFCKKNAEIKQE